MRIENTVRFHHHVGSLLAKTMASGKVCRSFGYSLFNEFRLQGFENDIAAAGNTTGAPAYKYGTLHRHITPSCLYRIFWQLSWDSNYHMYLCLSSNLGRARTRRYRLPFPGYIPRPIML